VPSRLAAPALRTLIGYFPVTFAFARASLSPGRQTCAPDGNCDRCDREPNENGTSKDLSCNACVPYLQNRVFRRVWIKANGNGGADRIARDVREIRTPNGYWLRARARPSIQRSQAASARFGGSLGKKGLCRVSGCVVLDPKVVQPFTGSKLRPEPAGLLAAPGPRFRRVLGILKFGEDFWIRPSLTIRLPVLPMAGT